LGREFRSRREGALKEAASVGQRKIDAESWRKSVEFRIEVKKKEMETHGVTEARTEELEELWSEESRNENARKVTAQDDSKTRGDIEEDFRRWTHAWLEVDAVLDPVWTNAKILRPYQGASLTEVVAEEDQRNFDRRESHGASQKSCGVEQATHNTTNEPTPEECQQAVSGLEQLQKTCMEAFHQLQDHAGGEREDTLGRRAHQA
jgi:hypothetical protein